MQELPTAAFFTPAEAEALLSRSDRSVLVLSHRWLHGDHPDPMGVKLAALRRYLASVPDIEDCGIFIDFASVRLAITSRRQSRRAWCS